MPDNDVQPLQPLQPTRVDTMESLAHRILDVERQVTHIMDTCCSMKSFEERVKTNMLLESMNKQLTNLVEENKELKEAIDLHKKYLHIAVGVFMALQVFGVPEKVRLLLG